MTDLYGVLTTAPEDGSSVRFERDYDATGEDVWSAITDPDRLARWLDPVTGDLRVGGRVTVHFDDGDGEFDVVTCEPPRALTVRWQHAEHPSEVRTVLTPVGEGVTRLVLEHTGLRAAPAPGYAAGWHWHLDALDAVLHDQPPGQWSTFDALYADYAARAAAAPA